MKSSRCLIKICFFLFTICILTALFPVKAQDAAGILQDKYSVRSQRTDGRFLSTYGAAHEMLKNTNPRYAFQPDFTHREFQKWQKGVKKAMAALMQHPTIKNIPPPILLKTEKRDGYRLEKWEFYPLPECVSTFLVLIPDNLTHPVPAVLCIPGSGGSKEGLAGEPGTAPKFNENIENPKVTMALNMVKEGYIAVAVDNAAAGEASDLEQYVRGRNYDYDIVSRYFLEMGWSYLGYTSYLDMQVLNWMKTHNTIRKDRIVISGFSLGTEPLMVLGILDPSIYAFVYNDFLCHTQERALVMTVPDKNGTRPFPNSIRHLIPGFWKYFNFPDIVAALAPRPIILTEGGADRDLELVRAAYRLSGHPENIETHHYAKFADPAKRQNFEYLPEGLDRNEYFKRVNVDGTNHYFKNEFILPWLRKILTQ